MQLRHLNLWMEFCEPTLGNCPVVVVLVLAVCSEDPDTLHPGQSQAVLGQEVAEHGILLEAPTEGYVDHQHAISIGLRWSLKRNEIPEIPGI